MIKIGIIGVGRWGPNLLRNFLSLEDVTVSIACDTDPGRLVAIAHRFPDLRTTTLPEDILKNRDLDATVISTPLSSHFCYAMQALETGHHVFVEKPLANSSSECRRMIELAERKNKTLFVGHTFKYNASIRAAKEYINNGELGKIYFIDATRTNFGPVRFDTNALWDLASHDISIFSYWLNDNPRTVSARGAANLNTNVEDVVYATFEYGGGIIAHVHASWLNPRKTREITVVGEKKMLIWNDINLSEPIRIYNKGIDKGDEYQDTFASFRLSIREGDVVIPNIKLNEPLLEECTCFIECMRTGSRPMTDGQDGLNVVKVLEAATDSMKNRSISILIN